MGLTVSTAEALFDAGVDVITQRQPHLGQARDLPVPGDERARPAAAQLRHTRRPRSRLGHLPGARRHRPRRDQPPGPDVHAADREPVHRRRPRSSTRRSEPLPPVRLVDFHCELTSEKNALGHLPRRPRQRRRRHPHAHRHGRRADPDARHGLPHRHRHDRPDRQRHRLQPAHRPAAVHQRPADAVRGGGGPGHLQRRPDRHRPGHRPRPRRSSASSGSSTSDGADPSPRRRGRRIRSSRRARPRSTSTRHTNRSDGVQSTGRARRGGRGRRASRPSRSPTTTRSPATRRHATSPPAPAIDLIPGLEINTVADDADGFHEGELHVLGYGVDPAERRPPRRPRHPAPAAPPAVLADRGAAPGRWTCRSTTSSSALPLDDDDSLGRPTVARALVAKGYATSRSTTRSATLLVARPAGVRAAPGPRPEGRHRGDHAAPAASPCSRISRKAAVGRRSCGT